ncbi:MAG: protein kinase family protein, partial [Planctomycetota bacterium]
TPAYMPPEQAAGKVGEIDERSDVFALGGILYGILTYEAPYSAETAVEALRRAMAGNVIPPRRRTPWNRIPKELESVCLKAMAREREDRYGTVEALVGDVRSFLDHRLVGAHRYGLMSRIMRFVQRHPTGSVSGGVALVLLAAGAAVSGVAFGEARAYRARAREKEVERAREAERAELESYRRVEAERGMEAAVGARDEARDNLVKGRRVAALLRAAEAALGKAHLELKRVCNSPASREERRACWDKWAPRIEAFERGVAEDAASQATWHALKGWLLRHGAQEKEAFGEFAKARKADPDVTYGWLFEAMVRLSEYLDAQPLPAFTTETGIGITFDDPPAETALMRLVGEYFERLMEEVSSAAVWGESSSRDLKEVLEGLKRLQEGEYREAESGLSRALQVPELSWLRSELLLARAMVRHVNMSFGAGLEDVEQVLAEQDRYPQAWIIKGLLREGEGAAISVRGADPRNALGKAIAAYTEALRLVPDATAYNNRGNAYRSFGEAEAARGEDPRANFRRAIGEYDQALRSGPEDAMYYENRGNAYCLLGNADRARGMDPRESFRLAIADLCEALRMNPNSVPAYVNRGATYWSLGEAERAMGVDSRGSFHKAIADYDEALRLDSELVLVYTNRGNAYHRLGDVVAVRGEDPRDNYRRAIAEFGEALRRNPEYVGAYTGRGSAYRSLGNAEGARGGDPRASLRRAITEFGEALRRNPEYMPAYNNRGNAYQSLGKAEAAKGEDPRDSLRRAIADFGEALRRNPEYARGYCSRGRAYMDLGNAVLARGEDPRPILGKAIADFGEALRKNPGLASAYSSRGLAYRSLGDVKGARGEDPRDSFRKAIADHGEAVRRNPKFAPSYINQGAALISLGKAEQARGGDPRPSFKAALLSFRESLKRNPLLWQAHANQGILLELMGRPGEAVQSYEKALAIVKDGNPSLKQRLAHARAAAATAPGWANDLNKAGELIARGDYTAARELFEKGISAAREAGAHKDLRMAPFLRGAHYNLACILSLASAGKPGRKAQPKPPSPKKAAELQKEALDHLRKAHELGYKDLAHIRKDPDLAPIRDLPEFKALLAEWEEKLGNGKSEGKKGGGGEGGK